MQFDIDLTWGRNKAASDAYLSMLAEDYFYVVKEKSVLEIASHNGAQTSALLYNNPTKIICVEPDPLSPKFDIFQNPIITFHSGTANDYYRDHRESVDVVTCFGLFYHLHSPFHLIEQIVNYSDPKYIIIETLWDDSQLITEPNNSHREMLILNYEEPDAPGNFFKDRNITKPVKLNVEIKYKYIRKAFIDAGYGVVKETVYNNKYDIDSKRGAAITLFEKL